MIITFLYWLLIFGVISSIGVTSVNILQKKRPHKKNLCYNTPLPCATRPLGHIVLRDSLNIRKGFKLIKK
jgi:hypothetical protein